MGRFEERRAEFEAKGVKLAAVCVDPLEKSQRVADKLELGYPILADTTGDAIRAFGVWHEEKKIAIPAVFVLDRDKVIRWKKVGASVTDRPSEDEVLDVVGRLPR